MFYMIIKSNMKPYIHVYRYIRYFFFLLGNSFISAIKLFFYSEVNLHTRMCYRNIILPELLPIYVFKIKKSTSVSSVSMGRRCSLELWRPRLIALRYHWEMAFHQRTRVSLPINLRSFQQKDDRLFSFGLLTHSGGISLQASPLTCGESSIIAGPMSIIYTSSRDC